MATSTKTTSRSRQQCDNNNDNNNDNDNNKGKDNHTYGSTGQTVEGDRSPTCRFSDVGTCSTKQKWPTRNRASGERNFREFFGTTSVVIAVLWRMLS